MQMSYVANKPVSPPGPSCRGQDVIAVYLLYKQNCVTDQVPCGLFLRSPGKICRLMEPRYPNRRFRRSVQSKKNPVFLLERTNVNSA